MNDPIRVNTQGAITQPVPSLKARTKRPRRQQPDQAPGDTTTQSIAAPAPTPAEPKTHEDSTQPTEPAPTTPTAAHSHAETAPATPKPRQRRPQTAAKGSGTTSKEPTTMTLTSLHLPRALVDALKAREARDNLTHGGAIVLAYKQAAPILAELVAADSPEQDPDFPLDIPPPPARRSDTIQLGARVTRRTIAGIDQFVAESGARSRSHLTTLVLQHWLDQDPTS